MLAASDEEASHFRLIDDLPYGQAPLGGNEMTLHCSLYLPEGGQGRPPLFLFFHHGAFKFGSYKQKICKRLGRRLTREGIAVAAVQYRLRAEESDLSEQVRDHLQGFQALGGRFIRPGLCQARSLAALEDGLRFLDWAAENADRFGWSDRRIAAGASAGGITAFNLAFSPPALGLEPRRIDGVYSTSGGYNYPALVHQDGDLIALSQHSPADKRVSVEGVRMLKQKLGSRMDLIESESMIHGHLDLVPDERPVVTFRRISAFVHKAAAC